MSLGHGASVVRSGLVLHLDAANPKSYPGSGTAWYDLSGLGNNGTLVNGVGYSSDSAGAMVFDGVDDLVSINSYKFNHNDNYTYEVWFKPSGGGIIDGLIGGQNNPAIRYGQGGPGIVRLFLGWSESPGYRQIDSKPVAYNKWHHVVGVVNATSGMYSLHIDTTDITIGYWTVGSISVPPTTLFLNRRDSVSSYIGSMSACRVYNRALGAQEIKQNFEALRGRYGI